MELVFAPNEMLNRKCLRVEEPIPQQTIDMMREIMKANNGCGLAAPQVGIPLRFFVTEDLVVINPMYYTFDPARETRYESCLSIPGMRLPVSRPTKIHVNYKTPDGASNRTVEGLEARIFLHEIDHLDGILFPTRFAEMFNAS